MTATETSAPRQGRGWLGVLLCGVVGGALAWWGAALEEADCSGLGECLSNGIAGLGFVVFGPSVVALIGMAVLGHRGRELLAPIFLLGGAVAAYAAHQQVLEGTGLRLDWALPIVFAGLLLGCWLMVRTRPTPPVLRFGVIAAVVALLVSVILVGGAQQ